MVLKIFKFFDLYGESVKFTVFKNDVYKTHVGGLFSILAILSIICSCVYFGKDFYMRTNPYFSQQMFTLPNYQILNINNSNFFIGFNFVYGNESSVDISQYLDINIGSVNGLSTNNGFNYSPVIKINYSNCSNFNDFDLIKSYNLSFSKNLQCLNITNTKIGGYWDNKEINYLSIWVSKCSNRIDCKNDTDLKNLLKEGIAFSITTLHLYTDFTQKDQILRPNFKYFETSLDFNFKKEKRIFYKSANISTDMGILTTMKRNYSLIGIDYDRDDFTSRDINDSNDNIFMESLFYLGQTIDVYIVNYMKIQEVFANLGGIISFINLIFSNISLIFNSHYKNIKLINKLFDFSNLGSEKNLLKIIEDQNNYDKK